jgi:hypothetical protein
MLERTPFVIFRMRQPNRVQTATNRYYCLKIKAWHDLSEGATGTAGCFYGIVLAENVASEHLHMSVSQPPEPATAHRRLIIPVIPA